MGCSCANIRVRGHVLNREALDKRSEAFGAHGCHTSGRLWLKHGVYGSGRLWLKHGLLGKCLLTKKISLVMKHGTAYPHAILSRTWARIFWQCSTPYAVIAPAYA
jgi:hypothetical protein